MNPHLADSGACLAALLTVALTGVSACDGGSGGGMGGGNGSLSVSFAGPWEGTWIAQNPVISDVNTTVPGALTLQLDQIGTNVTGTATFAGHPCLATCTVSCQVNGHDMSGWFHAGSAQMMFSGYCPESTHCSGPHHANTLTATYEIHDGPCAGESGVIQLTPVAADQLSAPEVGSVYVGELILVDQADGKVVRLPLFERP
jgi:hypothetical protein